MQELFSYIGTISNDWTNKHTGNEEVTWYHTQNVFYLYIFAGFLRIFEEIKREISEFQTYNMTTCKGTVSIEV